MKKIIKFLIIIGIIPGIYIVFLLIGLILGLPIWLYLIIFGKNPNWQIFELIMFPWGLCLLSLKYIIDWDKLLHLKENSI